MAQPSPKPPSTERAAKTVAPRRGFLTTAGAICIGGIVGLVPLLSGLAVFLDPLRRRGQQRGFIRVATLDGVPDDGIPRQFPVIAERIDAWNRSLEPIGSVYLRRMAGQQQPECLTATCPHAGCMVAFDGPTGIYKCPCHNSAFQADGQIIQPSPSPRAMDTLECKVLDSEILVEFQNFYSGMSEKVAKE